MKVMAIGAAAVVALGVGSVARAQNNDVVEGEKLYTSQCKLCHGNNKAIKTGELAPAPTQWRVVHASALQPDGTTRSDAGEQLAFAPPFGPNLRGVVGRPAGTLADFHYSSAFLEAMTGMAWTEANLDRWISGTQAWVPGAMMYYKQKDAEIRRKIILYLQANP